MRGRREEKEDLTTKNTKSTKKKLFWEERKEREYPDFTFEALPQVYRRTELLVYRYESSGGSFTTDVTVNANGFVIDYPPFWGR